jgi:nucleoside-diphosphate-sugar epimerase
MNYCISGKSGFIGTAISKYLIKKEDTVYSIGRYLSISELIDYFSILKPDYIIHASSYGNHSDQKNFNQMIETNIIGTYNLLEAAKTINYKKFYNISTSSALLKTQTYYSITKLCGEQLAGMYLDVVNVRPYSVYGPGEASHRFIPTVINCLNSDSEMILDEVATHAWIYIDDFIKAMFDGETELGGVFVSNKEIVSILENISGKQLKYTSGKLREYNCADVPAPGICYTSLHDGLKLTYEYYTRKNH